jgi:hypothetical protein
MKWEKPMSNHTLPEDRRLDDRLAEMADKIIDNDSLEHLDLSGLDPEERQLTETIIQLKQAFKASQPDGAMAKRMRSEIMAEWQKSKKDEQPEPKSSRVPKTDWFPRFKLSLAWGIMAAIVLIIGVVYTIMLPGQITYTAAAGNTLNLDFILLLTGAILIALIVWLIRRK